MLSWLLLQWRALKKSSRSVLVLFMMNEQGNDMRDNYRMYMVINYSTYIGIIVHAFLVPFFLLIGLSVLGVFNIFSASLWLFARIFNNKQQYTIAASMMVIEICLHSSLAVFYLGWNAGFQYYLMPCVPFLLSNTKSRDATVVANAVICCILFVALYTFSLYHVQAYSNAIIIGGMQYVNAVVGFIGLIIISYYFRATTIISERKMEMIANTDKLTGLANRRGIQQVLDAHYQLHRRNGNAFCVVMADVDNFKQVNDVYGHDCGDYVLKAVAGIIANRLRKSDAKSRWGGEEFLFMLPDADLSHASGVAESIRKCVEEYRFTCNGNELRLTLTLGVAQQEEGNSIEDTIKQADDLLYIGKKNGRNQVRTIKEMQGVDR